MPKRIERDKVRRATIGFRFRQVAKDRRHENEIPKFRLRSRQEAHLTCLRARHV